MLYPYMVSSVDASSLLFVSLNISAYPGETRSVHVFYLEGSLVEGNV